MNKTANTILLLFEVLLVMVLKKKQIFFIFSPINTDYYIHKVKNLLYAKIYKITYHLPPPVKKC